MNPYPADAVIERWLSPVPMDTGAPNPVMVREADRLWVGYLAHDPECPRWSDPRVTEYLESKAGEPFGVVWFDDVVHWESGEPSDETLHKHPFYGRGLTQYEFHRISYRGQ